MYVIYIQFPNRRGDVNDDRALPQKSCRAPTTLEPGAPLEYQGYSVVAISLLELGLESRIGITKIATIFKPF